MVLIAWGATATTASFSLLPPVCGLAVLALYACFFSNPCACCPCVVSCVVFAFCLFFFVFLKNASASAAAPRQGAWSAPPGDRGALQGSPVPLPGECMNDNVFFGISGKAVSLYGYWVN